MAGPGGCGLLHHVPGSTNTPDPTPSTGWSHSLTLSRTRQLVCPQGGVRVGARGRGSFLKRKPEPLTPLRKTPCPRDQVPLTQRVQPPHPPFSSRCPQPTLHPLFPHSQLPLTPGLGAPGWQAPGLSCHVSEICPVQTLPPDPEGPPDPHPSTCPPRGCSVCEDGENGGVCGEARGPSPAASAGATTLSPLPAAPALTDAGGQQRELGRALTPKQREKTVPCWCHVFQNSPPPSPLL